MMTAAAAVASAEVEGVTVGDLTMMGMREIGGEAVISLSSAKPGNGVEQIRDGSLETYWQSDGGAPHIINIHFMEKKTISCVCLYCDFNLDESYSIKKINIRGGSTAHDLVDVTTVEVNEPVGWVTIPLNDPLDRERREAPLRAHLLQIRILAMHQNGRDTHLRQLKVFGPLTEPIVMGGFKLSAFKTVGMLQHSQLR